MDKARALENIEKPRLGRQLTAHVLEAELVRPSDEGAEHQLVVKHDHDGHGEDRRADRDEVLVLDGERHIGSDPGERDVLVADGDRLGRHHEEPTARHGHHHVPDEARHGEGHLEAPETLPNREAEGARRLVQIVRHREQGLVEAERHVPGLAREDGEDRRALGTGDAVREKTQEERDRKGKIAQHRNRLQHVEERDEHDGEPTRLAGERAIQKRENERGDECRQHSEHGAQRVLGQVPGIERNRGRLQNRDGCGHLPDAEDEGEDHTEDERNRHDVPAVGSERAELTYGREIGILAHFTSPARSVARSLRQATDLVDREMTTIFRLARDCVASEQSRSEKPIDSSLKARKHMLIISALMKIDRPERSCPQLRCPSPISVLDFWSMT